MTNNNIPQDATPISTEELLACIGELTIQVRVLRRMIDAIKGEDKIQNNNYKEREESKASF